MDGVQGLPFPMKGGYRCAEKARKMMRKITKLIWAGAAENIKGRVGVDIGNNMPTGSRVD